MFVKNFYRLFSAVYRLPYLHLPNRSFQGFCALVALCNKIKNNGNEYCKRKRNQLAKRKQY